MLLCRAKRKITVPILPPSKKKKKMMNRSSSEETFLVPSMMSSVGGLDAAATLKQHHAAASSSWDNWDATTATSHNPAARAAAPQNHSFFLNPPALDCWPPLLPVSNFPLYSPPLPPPPPPPEYLPMAGLIQRDIHHFGCGGRIGLNHGHLTYFSPGNALAIDHLLGRRSRTGMYWLGGGHHRQLRRCQVEGCRADLSGAKHYHRRHKVCEFHSKASVAVVAGFRQRFCQQCSRFHALAQFDESKRSCRERLADHNRRRRKPQLIVPAPAAHAHAPATAAAADRSSSASVSVSKNTNTNSNNSEKSKQLQKTTKISAKSTICTTNTSTKISSNGEGVLHQHPVQENLMRNSNGGPALSLGGVAAEKVGNGSRSNTIYQALAELLPLLASRRAQ